MPHRYKDLPGPDASRTRADTSIFRRDLRRYEDPPLEKTPVLPADLQPSSSEGKWWAPLSRLVPIIRERGAVVAPSNLVLDMDENILDALAVKYHFDPRKPVGIGYQGVIWKANRGVVKVLGDPKEAELAYLLRGFDLPSGFPLPEVYDVGGVPGTNDLLTVIHREDVPSLRSWLEKHLARKGLSDLTDKILTYFDDTIGSSYFVGGVDRKLPTPNRSFIRVDMPAVEDVWRRIIKALKILEKQGIVIKDLHHDNIGVRSNNIPVIRDYGRWRSL